MTICVKCDHHHDDSIGGEAHLCKAFPYKKVKDPVTGKQTFDSGNGRYHTIPYAFCSTINVNGNCPLFRVATAEKDGGK